MEKIDNGDSLISIKKRIADILYKNDLAISKFPIEKEHDILDNGLISRHNKLSKSFENALKMDSSKSMIAKTNANGIIVSVNDFFLEISGCREVDLIGQLYNINYHPDMPRVISDNVWAKLNNGENLSVLVKNLTKDGLYFWSLNHFETTKDKNGNILSYQITSKTIPDATILQIERIYNTLASIEKTSGVKSSYKYLVGLLEDENCTYDTSIIEILASDIGLRASSYNELKAKTNLVKRRNELLVTFFKKKKKTN